MVNPKELKLKIITELGEKEMIYCETLKELDWSYFSRDEKREIKEAIFENVKENKEGWSIKKINTVLPRALPYNEKGENEMLIHQSAEIKYDDEGFLIHDYRRMSYKVGFTDEEWKELEIILKEQHQIDGSRQQQDNKVEQLLKGWFPFGSGSRGNKS